MDEIYGFKLLFKCTERILIKDGDIMDSKKSILDYVETYKLCEQSISCPVINELMGLYESFDGGIHIINGDGITLLYNEECERIDGLKASEVLGKNMEDLVKEGIFSRSLGLKAIENKEIIEDTQRVGERFVYTKATPIIHNNEVIRVLIISKDISKLSKYESQLKQLKKLNEMYRKELSISNSIATEEDRFVAKSKVMQQVKDLALRVAKSDSTVLIEGESGTGKGLLSEYIHNNSLRSDSQFLKIDCSAIPESLLESELFGYEAGAFTGAKSDGKIGLIQLADKGTLFLDEIGELSLKLQSKLLRVIQDRVFYSIGGTKPISVDVRIIAATNRNLLKMVSEGKFREDLYYRLSVIPIHMPPLRGRREDIISLINKSISTLNEHYSVDKKISPNALRLLIDYDWPGNVRELQNVIERLVVITEGNIIETRDVNRCNLNFKNNIEIMKSDKTYKEIIKEFEANLLLNLMEQCDNLEEMARIAQLNDSTIRKKFKRFGLELKFK